MFYFAGRAVQCLPKKLLDKQKQGMFVDRVGISHDLALIASDGSFYPVSKLQMLFTNLSHRIKRKVLLLDCRISNMAANYT